jgi:predicted nucleic acid-binding protein
VKPFVDTGGWVAYFDVADKYHRDIKEFFQDVFQRKKYRLATSDYVLDESVTYLRYNVGHATAVTAFNRIRAMVQQGIIDWLTVDEDIIQRAGEIFIKYDDQKFSFTDCTSFALCERERITHAVAVDKHFQTMRFILLPTGLKLP